MKKKKGEYYFYVLNNHIIPVFIKIELVNIENLKTDVSFPVFRVIKENSQKDFLFSLKVLDEKKSIRFNYRYSYILGDPYTVKHDDNYVYIIPYEHGTKHRVDQGYDGNRTHKGNIKYSIDFAMEVGTKIVASREGLVIDIKEDSNKGGSYSLYEKDANYIKIWHSDGSFATYAHLMKDGALVNIGDYVKQGDVIGLSGNTGYSSGPHLHFSVSIPIVNCEEISIPTKFFSYEGNAISLEEGEFYYSYHPGKEKFQVITDKNINEDIYKNHNAIIEKINKISFREEVIDNTRIIFIQNGFERDVKAEIRLSLQNFVSSQGEIIRMILPSLTEKFLTILRVKDKKINPFYSIAISYTFAE